MLEPRPIFKISSLSYYRDEKEGYATLVSEKHPELREMVINPTAKDILDLCDGSRGIKEICRKMSENYRGVSENVISKDVSKILGSYSRMGIISWEGGDPFVKRFEENFGNGLQIMIAQEEDITDLMTFMEVSRTKDSKDLQDFLCYQNPFSSEKEYCEVAMRQKLFAFTEDFFLLKKDNLLAGLLSISIPVTTKATSTSLGIIYAPESFFAGLVAYSIRHLPRICIIDGITKIKFFGITARQMDGKISEYLTKTGFLREGIMRSEIKNKDVEIYSYFYN